MFTGLVETTGVIKRIDRGDASVLLDVQPALQPYEAAIGDSIALNGVCLTVESLNGPAIRFRAVHETLQRSTLAFAKAGDEVNLERSLRLSDRLGGHLVLGHVDAVASIVRDRPVGDSILRTFRAPETIRMLLAEKGSVAVDGISLTIAECTADGFAVSLIPHTLSATTMKNKHAGDQVNIECDVLARYIFHLLKSGRIDAGTGPSLLSKLESGGF
jgi:riboflavin synthase